MTPAEWRRAAERALRENGCPYPEADARILGEYATGLRGHAFTLRREPLTREEEALLSRALERRLNGEPVQYVTGEAYFMGFRFLSDPRALIPRADTECLCERAVAYARKKGAPRVLDLCCGTGCIGLSVKLLVPGARVTLADLSEDALALARENARLLGAEAGFRRGDMFGAVPGEAYDVICCNPPYIASCEIAGLSREVLREPASALDGGADGLDFYRILAREAGSRLTPGGVLLAEIGSAQEGAVKALLPGCTVERDLSGAPRVAVAERETVWRI